MLFSNQLNTFKSQPNYTNMIILAWLLLSTGIWQSTNDILLDKEIIYHNLQSNTSAGYALKTVAVYSSDSSFFKDYTIDTLVENLNLLNQNSAVVFVKNTNDDSKSGFSADYLVNLKLVAGKNINTGPKFETVRNSRTVTKAVQDHEGVVRYENVQEYYNEDVMQNRAPAVGKITITIQTIRKNPYKKMKSVMIESNAGEGNESDIIIKLIYNLLDSFKKVQ